MNCPRCGAPNAGEDKFCSNCGAPLEAVSFRTVCEHCGTPAVPGQQFCRRCGSRLPVPGAHPVMVHTESHASAAAAPPARPSGRPGPMKGILKVVVPICALIVSYYINDAIAKHYGAMLAAQFGDVSRQVVPVLVFTIVGGVAYKLVSR